MKDDRLYLHHMLERCTRALNFTNPGKGDFLASAERQDALILNIIVIGEAAKRVSLPTRAKLPQLDWRGICGMRDVLIHDYIGVDIEEVWNVASNELPKVREVLSRFLFEP